MKDGYRGEITEVKIESMPESTEEFINLRNDLAGTSEGGAAVFVIALLKYY